MIFSNDDFANQDHQDSTEVFVDCLANSLQIEDLVPFFARAGRILRLRLIMNFSGLNKGYCYVRYMDVNSAERAILWLNHQRIRLEDNPITVKKSRDNKSLCIKSSDLDELVLFIKQVSSLTVQEKCKAAVYRLMYEDTYAGILTYKNHREAALARKDLMKMFNIDIPWKMDQEPKSTWMAMPPNYEGSLPIPHRPRGTLLTPPPSYPPRYQLPSAGSQPAWRQYGAQGIQRPWNYREEMSSRLRSNQETSGIWNNSQAEYSDFKWRF